jgi:anti-sigma-K factor RskA
MNSWHRHVDSRAEELLADQAISGLDQQQAQELLDLLQADTSELQDEFMRTAALVQLGMLSQERPQLAPMPEQLRNRILAAAPRPPQRSGNEKVVSFPAPTEIDANTPVQKAHAYPRQSLAGWAVAAALALALVIVGIDSGNSDITTQRTTLINEAGDAIIAPWAAPEDPRFSGVSGDVVWSDARQAGFLRLSGMPANDPESRQYQLWIIDPERSPQPIDGGVFDVQAGTNEVIIPIDAKLAVNKPTAFAITLEKTGGVVVSEGPLLVIASAGS